ncbi:hypothetical protein Srot_0580 [Segniliparus rotundus DSM 44985]|uniref:Uncharacterized protein n=1 Tax=Segniliparus rotundus (strain ATCC BAA-972 / CDC 1076 / CIP 108378 / DSM 44985 / JCM 13578) TaxID=640132 RepID=D6ZCM0_SEGRD|nr:hypothetical protein [Segniliparus rotundus]ADG97062.1 hypothetical protein Srot_0580 [Segniliparus rotundus DSM 44985]
MTHQEDPALYQVIVHHDETGFWIALYDTQRGLRENRTALEADLLLDSEDAAPDQVQAVLLEQFGLVPLDAWELVTSRYGQGWQAPFGSAMRAIAA